MDFTGRNVYMGLAGFYLIEDDEERALNLPSGDHDIPVMIQVRQFASDGSFVYDNRGHLGAQGDVVLVNGAPWPRLCVERRKYRLRFLNASNATVFTLRLDAGTPVTLIATDDGLLPAPMAVERLPLATAERAEIVIDFADYAAGTRLVLYDADAMEGAAGASPTKEIMCFDVSGPQVSDGSVIPDRLVPIERLDPAKASRTRNFDFAPQLELAWNLPPVSWQINHKKFDPDRIDAAPRIGDLEIWHLRSVGGLVGRHVHPAHIHLVHFQVLERNGKPPPPHEAGWKDTVRLEDGDDVRVIARFAPDRGRFVFHCHNLGHEDYYMMGRFDVA
jgi:spore coat protein A